MYFPHIRTSWDKYMFNGIPKLKFWDRSELVPLRGKIYWTKSTLCNVKINPSLPGKKYGRSEVLYAVNRWAYFSCGTAIHWTEEKRASWEIFSDGAKLWHTTVGEFEYWSKYFQRLNFPPSSFPWRFVLVQGERKGPHRGVVISPI